MIVDRPRPTRGHDTKVSFAYAMSEQNVSANPLPVGIVRQSVETVRYRTHSRWPSNHRLTAKGRKRPSGSFLKA
jgi:hypothetical protein